MSFILRTLFAIALSIAPTLCIAAGQDGAAASIDAAAMASAEMRELEARVRTGKRAFVDAQLQLTPQEASGFWPLYEEYQSNLSTFNQRRLQIIVSYAEQFNAGGMQDASATKLAKQALRLEKDEALHMERAFQKISRVLPGVKAARYLQVEAKIRSLVRYEQAAQIPYAR